MTEELKGEIANITFRNKANGWTVARVIPENDPQKVVTVVGAMIDVDVGEHLSFSGKWADHAKFGKQFKFEKSHPVLPQNRTSTLKYLASGILDGVGEKTAKRIYEKFGDKTFDILNEEPHMLHQIDGLGRKKVQKIILSWKEKSAIHGTMSFLTQYDISLKYAQKIYKKYGDGTIQAIKDNPYQLIDDIRGIGFLKADGIALKMGLDPLCDFRIQSAILHILKIAANHGHCFITFRQLQIKLRDILKQSEIGDELIESNIELLLGCDKIIVETHDSHRILYSTALYTCETYTASKISLLLEQSVNSEKAKFDAWFSQYTKDSDIKLNKKQLLAIEKVLSSKVMILTGGPGVGKTTTTHAILNFFHFLGKSVVLTAPTGRAAQRMNEATGQEGAKTIHRLLEWIPEESRFKRDQDNPIFSDVFLIDESSMLDIQIASSLFSAIPLSAQVVFIGDRDQLPSVGPGTVLADLIDSQKIPSIELDEVYRQSEFSKIIPAAHAINSGQVPSMVEIKNGFDIESKADCQFIEADSAEDILSVTEELVTTIIPKSLKLDVMSDCQILTPMNRGPLGTIHVNQLLQKSLNPASLNKQETKVGDHIFRKYDKVLQTQNNYDHSIFNGDIGIIKEANIDGGHALVEFGSRTVKLPNDQLYDMALAYAITIHKSQGSEFPVVIIPMSTHHYVMLQRNLIYTALTRAKKLAIFIGQPKALKIAVQTISNKKRQTRLKERVQ